MPTTKNREKYGKVNKIKEEREKPMKQIEKKIVIQSYYHVIQKVSNFSIDQ